MKNKLRNFLSKSLIVLALMFMPIVGFCAENNSPNNNGMNLSVNSQAFNKNMTFDLMNFQNKFQQNLSSNGYVPIEARIGYSLIGGLSVLNDIMKNSLIPFISVFLILLFIFWVFMESYQMIKSDQNARKLTESIVKKLVLISIWIWIINFGPAKLFMMLIGPIMQFVNSKILFF